MMPMGEIRDGHRVWKEAPHRHPLADYPGGPKDDVLAYGVLFRLADDGIVRPTNKVRNGQRVFESLIYKPKA
jgi:hypothetical protein